MNLPLEFHPSMEADIDDAFNWYEQRRHGLGSSFLDEIERVYSQIRMNPFRYAIVEDDIRIGQLKKFPFIIPYRVLTDRIRILAIYHATRDSSQWQDRY